MFYQCQPEEISSLTYYWTINLVKDKLLFPIEKYCFVSTNSLQEYPLNKSELEFGTYNLSVTVVSNDNPSYFKQLKSKLMTVDLSKLSAKIQGVSELYLGWNDTYELDFWSGSYDPEAIDIENKDALKFNIICSKELTEIGSNDLNRQLNNTVYDHSYAFEDLGFQLAFHYENINFYEKDCFEYSDLDYLNQSIEYDIESHNFTIRMTSLNINESNPTPITMRLYVSDDYRVSSANQVLNLNTSDSFLGVEATDLNMMAKQLEKLDEIASKNPKQALNYVGKLTSNLNSFDGSSSSDVNLQEKYLKNKN